MNIAGAVLATGTLPPIAAMGYEYVLAGNGLFIRAEDSNMEAMVPIAPARLHGLADVASYARLKLPRVPMYFLRSVLDSARDALPNEAMYQFTYAADDRWHCYKPGQLAGKCAVDFNGRDDAVIDLHSHGSMPAFFSPTDNEDEQGLEFYAVIGNVNSDRPKILVRVGVYGHFMPVKSTAVFEHAGPFIDLE